MQTYGGARIAANEQHADRQIIALKNFGVDSTFVDQQSGKNFKRPQYQKLLRKFKPNDTLVVKSIDRLGRDYADILEQWRIISKEKGSAVVVLDVSILDTRSDRDLIGTLVT